MIENTIKDILIQLKLSTPDSFQNYYNTVRDRNDITVNKCIKSDVIILSRTDHITEKYYINNTIKEYWNTKQSVSFDDLRRKKEFGSLIKNKKWLDFGSGQGGILNLMKNDANHIIAIEIQDDARNVLIKKGYETYKSIKNVVDTNINVVSLFHVFEHLPNPIKTLKTITNHMSESGIVIIEVPHANDILLSVYNNEHFKKHTFWSEHLILHTKNSLKKFVESADLTVIKIYGIQRYPLSNHLYWIIMGLPNGQNVLKGFNKSILSIEYEKMLIKINKTDTLVCIASNIKKDE